MYLYTPGETHLYPSHGKVGSKSSSKPSLFGATCADQAAGRWFQVPRHVLHQHRLHCPVPDQEVAKPDRKPRKICNGDVRFLGDLHIFFQGLCPSKVSILGVYVHLRQISRSDLKGFCTSQKDHFFLVDTYLSSTQKLCITRSCWSWHIVSFSSPKLPKPVTFNEMGVEPKIAGFPPKWMVKMMVPNPMNKWMIWVVFPHIFGSTPKIRVGS